jgi:ribosome assembly protein YihI (activator of Der GTPase)
LAALEAEADRIAMERRANVIGTVIEKGLTQEQGLAMYLDADLGSIDVFVKRWGLSLEQAVALYCTTSNGRNNSQEDIMQMLREVGHPLTRRP